MAIDNLRALPNLRRGKINGYHNFSCTKWQ